MYKPKRQATTWWGTCFLL